MQLRTIGLACLLAFNVACGSASSKALSGESPALGDYISGLFRQISDAKASNKLFASTMASYTSQDLAQVYKNNLGQLSNAPLTIAGESFTNFKTKIGTAVTNDDLAHLQSITVADQLAAGKADVEDISMSDVQAGVQNMLKNLRGEAITAADKPGIASMTKLTAFMVTAQQKPSSALDLEIITVVATGVAAAYGTCQAINSIITNCTEAQENVSKVACAAGKVWNAVQDSCVSTQSASHVLNSMDSGWHGSDGTKTSSSTSSNTLSKPASTMGGEGDGLDSMAY